LSTYALLKREVFVCSNLEGVWSSLISSTSRNEQGCHISTHSLVPYTREEGKRGKEKKQSKKKG
jgi:hypothetical protein